MTTNNTPSTWRQFAAAGLAAGALAVGAMAFAPAALADTPDQQNAQAQQTMGQGSSAVAKQGDAKGRMYPLMRDVLSK
jgi:hypothetical protein